MDEHWHTEYRQILDMAAAVGLQPDSQGSLAGARAFAQELVQCPNEARAIALMKANPSGAATFLDLARHYDRELRKGVIERVRERPEESTPFFVVAGAVLEILEHFRKDPP